MKAKKKSIDPIELNVPNICFSLVNNLPKTDSRLKSFKKQRLKRGFDETELWNLNYTIAKFIYPRLKVFVESTPVSLDDDARKALNEMVWAFETLSDYEKMNGLVGDKKERVALNKRLDKAFYLFADYFGSLWW